jgi:hypothetical protein
MDMIMYRLIARLRGAAAPGRRRAEDEFDLVHSGI